MPYEAPLPLMRLTLGQAARAAHLYARVSYAETLEEVGPAVLESAARLAREVLSPLNRAGDVAGCRLENGSVVTPTGFRSAYTRFCEDGWPALAAPTEFGGQGLPMLLAAAATEMWGGANLSFAMCPEAASGAIEALAAHAAASLRREYLPPLVSGAWTASMCLTEPQAGSDLSTVRTSAEPEGEHWRLSGRKTFISWGDHDLTENIVHLVLARTPQAPAGAKGLSLFLVPKRLPGGGAHDDNDIRAIALEHKMGIRASPTCAMALGERGGARGWLIGALHGGLECMFTMMNHMRLGVALHSTGLAERARQLALGYAQERRQGRNAAGAQRPIIEHTDVRRMLLSMSVLTQAARALAYTAAATLDAAHDAQADASQREPAQRRLALLTPLAKAWCSDVAHEVASLGIQVHGGMGYMEDCEISQVFRDSRIGSIYEGTNYIQAHDLLTRRVLRDDGATLEELLADIRATALALPTYPALSLLRERLLVEVAELRLAARGLLSAATAEHESSSAVAGAFLQWLAVTAGGWQWALSALEAAPRILTDAHARTVVNCAAFYAAQILPRARTCATLLASGAAPILGADPLQL